MAQAAAELAKPLVAAAPEAVREDLDLVAPEDVKAKSGQDKALDKKAEENVAQLLDIKDDEASHDKSAAAVEEFGLELQKSTAQQSGMLQRPIKELSKRSVEGGEVANALINLKMTVEDLDPAKLNLSPGWFSRMVGNIPGVGTPLKRYFSRFESAQTVIAAIVASLEQGKDQLGRDNVTLQADQARLRELTERLEKAIKLGQLMDAKLEKAAAKEEGDKAKFISEELLFPLRQRIMDLQQQLAVAQQGIIAMEIIIRNNKELIRGVNRALLVTVSALQVAVTVAMALNQQQIVLDKVGALTNTTNNLIKGTASRLKTQGVEIHKQAANAQLSVDALRQAFADIHEAMDDLSRFRQEALPKMAGTILEMDKLTADAEGAIKRVEKGDRAKPSFQLDVD
jgi:uncharacterized protein YaaN involved in tellurite resistance